MIVIFDLDDTLYEESTYVKSSFKAVAFYISEKYSLSENTIFEDLILVPAESVSREKASVKLQCQTNMELYVDTTDHRDLSITEEFFFDI